MCVSCPVCLSRALTLGLLYFFKNRVTIGAYQRVVGDEQRDVVVAGVQDGEAAVVRLVDEVRAVDPRGWQPFAGEVAGEQLLQAHAPPRPVEQLVHVAQQVDGRHDARDDQPDDQQREYDGAPVVAIPRAWVQQLLYHNKQAVSVLPSEGTSGKLVGPPRVCGREQGKVPSPSRLSFTDLPQDLHN